MAQIKERVKGVVARVGGDGSAEVTAHSGNIVPLAYSPLMAGTNPLEFLDSALAGCLAISIRIAATKRGLREKIVEIAVEVIGEKAQDQPSRIKRQHCRYKILGDITEPERQQLIHDAHAMCTIGHSLTAGVEIVDGEPLTD